VDATAEVADGVRIGPGVVIGPRCRIGAGTRLYANVAIGEDCLLGDDTVIMPNVVLYPGVTLGERCIVHSGSVIGADGFGFTPGEGGRLETIAQIGGVVIGADVSIGACTTIDRGAIDDTVIDEGVKIDNQVQIGHNCHIGAHSVICGCVGIVGSTRIGRHCVLAGGVGVGGDRPIEIADRVVVSGMTHVSSSISEPGVYSGGVLHAPNLAWKKNALRFGRLDELYRRVARLERVLSGTSSDPRTNQQDQS
jgi:UDP-3-O-[3-hydroxymyristoyl] glucosamine N-acyltransferase